MKIVNFILMFIITGFVPLLAQEAGEVVADVISNEDLIKLLLESIGGIKGASSLAIAGIVIKLVLAFFSSEMGGKLFSGLKGSIKLLIVTGLSLAAGVIALMNTSDLTFGAALLHSTTLSAFMVFVNQIYKQFFVKED